jgi:hypothetical protein
MYTPNVKSVIDNDWNAITPSDVIVTIPRLGERGSLFINPLSAGSIPNAIAGGTSATIQMWEENEFG